MEHIFSHYEYINFNRGFSKFSIPKICLLYSISNIKEVRLFLFQKEGYIQVQERLHFREAHGSSSMCYFRVYSYGLSTFVTLICKDFLVTFNAVRVVISEYVALPCEGVIALPAAEVPTVPVLVHGLGVLTREN